MDDDEIPTLIDHSQPVEQDAESKETKNNVKEDSNRRVPCTLISGFLGAGKSTLLKRILTERHGYRIAVIMNEFGDTADIEARAVNISSENGTPGELSEEFLELANGCLCCSIKDTGLAAIERLMQKKGAFDYILLETTGLADPGPIASMFWQNEEFSLGLGRDMYLDGVVCVVDALFGEKQIKEDASDSKNISLRQIACADVVLLNKADLAAEDTVLRIETIIRTTNPTAALYRTVRSQIDLKYVIGIDAYATRSSIIPSSVSLVDGENHYHGHEHDHSTHTIHEGISSLQVSCPRMTAAQAQRLDEWIRAALWEGQLLGVTNSGYENVEKHLVEVLRCKGVYALESGEQYVLQGVRSLYEITQVEMEGPGPGEGKLVFIGKGLDEIARSSLLRILR